MSEDEKYARLSNAADRFSAAKYEAEEAYQKIEDRVAEYEARIRQQQAEIKQRRQEAANAAFREQQLAKIANGTAANQLEQFRQQKVAELAQEYPELLTTQDTDRMARENPYRYAEAVKAYQRADNDIKAPGSRRCCRTESAPGTTAGGFRAICRSGR